MIKSFKQFWQRQSDSDKLFMVFIINMTWVLGVLGVAITINAIALLIKVLQ